MIWYRPSELGIYHLFVTYRHWRQRLARCVWRSTSRLDGCRCGTGRRWGGTITPPPAVTWSSSDSTPRCSRKTRQSLSTTSESGIIYVVIFSRNLVLAEIFIEGEGSFILLAKQLLNLHFEKIAWYFFKSLISFFEKKKMEMLWHRKKYY